jgi:hypothetical protein
VSGLYPDLTAGKNLYDVLVLLIGIPPERRHRCRWSDCPHAGGPSGAAADGPSDVPDPGVLSGVGCGSSVCTPVGRRSARLHPPGLDDAQPLCRLGTLPTQLAEALSGLGSRHPPVCPVDLPQFTRGGDCVLRPGQGDRLRQPTDIGLWTAPNDLLGGWTGAVIATAPNDLPGAVTVTTLDNLPGGGSGPVTATAGLRDVELTREPTGLVGE